MEEDMIMNVPSAPEMQGTPMAPNLSMEMQSQMSDVSQAEMQEAQGALMQILQVINMLIEQGLNEEQIRAFLEQYGISEDELDQAAQALGVDIDMVLSGQMQTPQEPMMMAKGGPASPQEIFNQLPSTLKGGLKIAKDDPSYLVLSNRGDNAFGPDGEIIGDLISLNGYISSLPNKYNNLLKKKDSSEKLKRQNIARTIFGLPASIVFPEGTSFGNQMIVDRAESSRALKEMQLTPLEQQFIEDYESYFGVKKMAEGGGADVGSITPISPFEMTEAFGGPLYQMLNPGAQQMVDRLGLRGQGLSGAAAMAFGPKKVKGGLTALDDLTRNFLAKEKTRLEGIIKSIKEGTDPILRKENLATYQKQLDNVNAEIAENARLRKQYDEMVKDPSKFFKTQD
jgi:DNA-binding transcriptional MerR regulator